VKTGFGIHQPSYSVGIWVRSLGVERPDRDADHSPPSSAVIKNE